MNTFSIARLSRWTHWTQVDNNSNTVVTTSFDLGANQRTITDPNTGTTIFVMDALGQVIRQTDANGAVIDFDYDLLGRITARTDDATGTAPITNAFSYDTRTNGIGLLASRSSPGFVEDTYYTAGAQVQRIETSVNVNGYSDSFTTSFTYDNYGRTASQTYPSGLTAHTDYNSYGYANQLRDGNNKVLSRVDTADHFGNPTKTTLGNGLITTRSYDGITGAITSINTDSGVIQDNSYSWWSNGILHQRSKGSTAETFTYDALNRLKSAATASTGRTLNFTYDKLGNLLSKTSNVSGDVDVTGYAYSGDNKPHRLNSVAIAGVTHTYGYDSVGNIVLDDVAGTAEDRSITYNTFGKPTEIRKGDASAPTAQDNFHYGPNGFRFYKQSKPSNDQTVYLHGGAFEVVIPETGDITAVEKSYLGDVIHYRDITIGGSSERYEYVHMDHLDSVQVITDELGQPVSGYGLKEFDAFGGYRSTDWSQDGSSPAGQLLGTNRGFTGHEHLDGTGLIHMNGRVYDPKLGRFMSADPIVQAPSYSQSYNRYAYVFNSPMSFADPSGYCVESCGVPQFGVMGVLVQNLTIESDMYCSGFGSSRNCDIRAMAHAETVKSAFTQLAFLDIDSIDSGGAGDQPRSDIDTGSGGAVGWQGKDAFDQELDALNHLRLAANPFRTKHDALQWLHQHAHPLANNRGVEVGANLFSNGEEWRIANIVTSYLDRHVRVTKLNASMILAPGFAMGATWHSHGALVGGGVSRDDRAARDVFFGYFPGVSFMSNFSFHVSLEEDGGAHVLLPY